MNLQTPSRSQSKSEYAGLIRGPLVRAQSQVEYAGLIRGALQRPQSK